MSLILFAKEKRHLMGKVQTSLEEEIFLRIMHPLHTIKNNYTLSLWLSIRCKLLLGNQSLLQTKNKNFVIRKSNICCSEIDLLENQFPRIESILGSWIHLLGPSLH